MEKTIIVRYAEIYLKGKNIAFFESKLMDNIKKALNGIECNVKISRCRYIVSDFDEFDEDDIIDRLKKVFGIHSLSPCYVVKSDLEKISETCADMVDFGGTFKVETNRADKKFPMKSYEISAAVGGYVLEKHPNLKVDVKHPEHVINVDMRENGKTFVYEKVIYCTGGLPTGCSGSGALMLSGGIDSPVAGYMIGKRGMTIHGVYFHSYPYTGDLAKEKVIKLGAILNGFTQNFALQVVPFTKIQEEIHKNCPPEFMITLMRRFMMRITEKLARKNRDLCIITGESLGQVASQTVESITVTNEVVNMPVFRPLIGMDKLEIIDVAKKIGTFETSNLPYEDCCTVFLPEHPVIRPKREDVYEAEKILDIDALVEEAVAGTERITY